MAEINRRIPLPKTEEFSAQGEIPFSNYSEALQRKMLQLDFQKLVTGTLNRDLRSDDFKVYLKARNQLELFLVNNFFKCDPEVVSSFKYRSFQLNPDKIYNLSNTLGIIDHNYQKGMSCVVQALTGEISNNPDDRLRQFIDQITKFGTASEYGDVYRLENNSNPLFVAKVSKHEPGDLIHEAAIGMILNNLRELIPNFVHTYGVYGCSVPATFEKRLYSYCPNSQGLNNTLYLITEYVNNAVSLRDKIKDLAGRDIMSIYLQIVNALRVAHHYYDFSHFDLHDENILIQIMPYYIAIPIYYENKISYLRTRYLVRIIDYGFAHIKLRKDNFINTPPDYFDLDLGIYSASDRFISFRKSYPVYDLLRILVLMYKHSVTKGSAFQTIASYFPAITSLDRLATDNVSFYQIVSQYYRFGAGNFDNLIKFLLIKLERAPPANSILSRSGTVDTSEKIIFPTPENAYLAICEDSCVTWEQFNKYIFTANILPGTITDFYLSYRATTEIKNDDLRLQTFGWLAQFDSEKIFNREYPQFQDNFTTNITQILDTNLAKYDEPYFDSRKYEKSVAILIELYHRFNADLTWINGAKLAFSIKNSKLPLAIDQWKDLISRTENKLKEFQSILGYNSRQDKIVFSPDYLRNYATLKFFKLNRLLSL